MLSFWVRTLSLFARVIINARPEVSVKHSLRVFHTDAEECGIGYQYRPPPEMMNCRANITVTRMECLIALPTIIPEDTRIDVVWYRRSIDEAQRGSDIALEVDNSPPFYYVHTVCNRQPVCPSHTSNLTVHISRLEISGFGPTLQGDYACRLVFVNQTTSVTEQAMQPSACVRLRLVPDQMQNCEILGQRSTWSCADTVHELAECPRQFLSRSTTSTSEVVVTPTFSAVSILRSQKYTQESSTSTFSLSTTGSLTSIRPLRSTPSPTSHPSPTMDGTPVHSPLIYIYIPLIVVSLLLLAAIGTAGSVILYIRRARHKKSINLKDGM